MDGFAAGAWVFTLIGGAYMWSYTASMGRSDSPARTTHLSPLVLFVHPTIAISGFAVWLVYMHYSTAGLAWTAFGMLVATAALGDVLAVQTVKGRREPVPVGVGGDPADRRRAEDMIPTAAIVAHGTTALATIVAVFIVAVQAST